MDTVACEKRKARIGRVGFVISVVEEDILSSSVVLSSGRSWCKATDAE